MTEIINKIWELTNKTISEKINKEVEEAHKRAEADREQIQKALDMISQGLVYKDISQTNTQHKYVLATEEMFFDDYIKPQNAFDSQILVFTQSKEGTKNYIYEGVFKVNRERYYDIRYIIQKYQDDLDIQAKQIKDYWEKLNDIDKLYRKLAAEWPQVKKLMEDWNNNQNI